MVRCERSESRTTRAPAPKLASDPSRLGAARLAPQDEGVDFVEPNSASYSLIAPPMSPAVMKRCPKSSSAIGGIEASTAVAMISFQLVISTPMNL